MSRLCGVEVITSDFDSISLNWYEKLLETPVRVRARPILSFDAHLLLLSNAERLLQHSLWEVVVYYEGMFGNSVILAMQRAHRNFVYDFSPRLFLARQWLNRLHDSVVQVI